MNRFLGLVLVLVLGVVASGCNGNKAETASFVSAPDVSALLALPDGGLRFATATGDVFDAGEDGKKVEQPLAKLAGATPAGILGLIADKDNRTFASYVEASSQKLAVARVAPGAQTVVFRSEEPASASPGGRMTISAENRIVITFTPDALPSRILSIDPDRADDQKANVISTNWNELGGVAYAAGRVLWALDDGGENNGRIARVGIDGPLGKVTNVGKKQDALALAPYGDSELVACFANSGVLKRFFISDGVQALEGRTLTKDCKGDVSPLRDGRIAYTTKTEIRITVI